MKFIHKLKQSVIALMLISAMVISSLPGNALAAVDDSHFENVTWEISQASANEHYDFEKDILEMEKETLRVQEVEAKKTELKTSATYNKLTDLDWDIKSKYRGVDQKHTTQLEWHVLHDPRDIAEDEARLQEMYLDDSYDLYDIIPLEEKIERRWDKFIACVEELRLREEGKVDRDTHWSTYYIDLDSGNDSAAGNTTGTAWLTLEKYTTTTVRSPGDVAYVRANTDETPVGDIAMDESGDADALIKIIGCDSVTNDPWSDGSDVKPKIDFAGGNIQLIVNKHYWWVERLDFDESSDANGAIYVASTNNCHIVSCDIHDTTGGKGVYVNNSASITFDGCEFTNNSSRSLDTIITTTFVRNCTFNDGVTDASNYAWNNTYASYVEFDTCTFGSTTPHNIASLNINSDELSMVKCRNCKFDDPAVYTGFNDPQTYIWSEDHDQVLGAHLRAYYTGEISNDSVVQLDGVDSVKMAPSSEVGAYNPMSIAQDNLYGTYAVYCNAAETTITLTARETEAWAVDPTSSEFYIEVSYLDDGGGTGSRTTAVSNDSLSGVTEVDFDVTFTPSAAGFAYVTVWLKAYEAGKSVNVSTVPTVE